eukprot:snap_masked-scaffold_49-processed-gene-1.87-mRNA-1 protein AED:1.00 eAED:1.00 QI:0/-1/0/0/-1/1/1/0/64
MLDRQLDQQKLTHNLFFMASATIDILLFKKQRRLSVTFQPGRKPIYNEDYSKLHQLAEKYMNII